MEEACDYVDYPFWIIVYPGGVAFLLPERSKLPRAQQPLSAVAGSGVPLPPASCDASPQAYLPLPALLPSCAVSPRPSGVVVTARRRPFGPAGRERL